MGLKLEVELTNDEIVAVKGTGPNDALVRCFIEGIWKVRLPSQFNRSAVLTVQL